MPKLFFVGNLTLDDIVYPDGRAQIGVDGGNSLYAAIGARIWGCDVTIVGVVGKDWPSDYAQRLQIYGIDTRYLKSVDSENLRAWILYEDDGQRTYVPRNRKIISLRPNIYDDVTLETSNLEAFGKAIRSLHLHMSPMPSMITKLDADALHICPMRLKTMLAWNSYVSQYPMVFTTADMFPISSYGNIGDEVLPSFLSEIDVFLPSIAEAKLLKKRKADLDTLCRYLASYGPRVIVIKDGNRGALIFERETNRFQRIPIYPSSVVDSTGAGDGFCGGFLAGMTSTGDPFQAALWGTVSASFIVEAYGGLHGLEVTIENAKKRLEVLKTLL